MKREISVAVWVLRFGMFDFILDRPWPSYPNQPPTFIAQDHGDEIPRADNVAKMLRKDKRHADARLFERLIMLRLYGKAMAFVISGARKL